jgi:hypothetical protein
VCKHREFFLPKKKRPWHGWTPRKSIIYNKTRIRNNVVAEQNNPLQDCTPVKVCQVGSHTIIHILYVYICLYIHIIYIYICIRVYIHACSTDSSNIAFAPPFCVCLCVCVWWLSHAWLMGGSPGIDFGGDQRLINTRPVAEAAEATKLLEEGPRRLEVWKMG